MKSKSFIAMFAALLTLPWVYAQPTFTKQPTNTSVSLSATAQFSIVATSTAAPVTYQWWFQETALDMTANPSAARNSLHLTNVTVAQAGSYFVIASDSSGLSATSHVATLTVDPTFIKITQSDIVQGAADMFLPYWVDLDGDGWLELVVAGGFFTVGGKPLMVYQNNGDGTLSRTLTHDLSKVSARCESIAWADIDNDGDLDGFAGLVETESSIFLRNDGGGRFTKIIADRWWTANGISAAGCCVTCADIDNNGILDLLAGYWGNYAKGVWGTNTVLRGLGDGRFTVDLTSPLALSHTWPEHWSWADWNGDGRLDLFGTMSGMSGNTQLNLMFQNIGAGQFLRITNSPPVQIRDISINCAWADYDNDRDLDLCVTSLNHTNQLYRNLGNGVFEPDPADLSFPAGQDRLIASWADYDNDGWLDLFVAQLGRPSQLFHNRRDGTFEEVTTGSPVNECQGYGVAWGDYDNDGFPDLFVVNMNTAVNYLYRNNLRGVGNPNGWLKVKLTGTASNRDGIGATVRIKAKIQGKELWQTRQIVCQSYEAALLAHFGLADATNVDLVQVEWPSGNVQKLSDIAPNRRLNIRETENVVPANPSASLNGAVTLTRKSAGAGASYQWQFNGLDLPGETNRTLQLVGIQADQAGSYSVVASNSIAITIDYVYLHVDKSFIKVTTGPVVDDQAYNFGCAWGDYDGDGNLDLYVPVSLWSARSPDLLFRNLGNGAFELIDSLPTLIQKGQYSGTAVWGDYDNDGCLDIYLTGSDTAGNLFHNLGHGTFDKVMVITPRNGAGSAWADYDHDGYLDLVLTPFGSEGGTLLWRNLGGQRFEEITNAFQPPMSEYSMSTAWGDYDADGFPDLFIGGNYGGDPNTAQLYHNDRHGAFQRVRGALGVNAADGSATGAWGDYDNDLDLDLFVTSWVRPQGHNRLYRNRGDGTFEQVTSGPPVTDRGNSGGAVWADFDNDGFLDLFVANGYWQGPGSNFQPCDNYLYRGHSDGSFTKVTTGSLVHDGGPSVSAAWADYNNDGIIDLFVGNIDTKANDFLYQGVPNGNAWLRVQLEGKVSNRSAVGARVSVRAQYAGADRWQLREIQGGDGTLHNAPLYAHFGLGDATNVNVVRIEWPSGIVQELHDVASRQILTVTEPPRLEALGQGLVRIQCWKCQSHEMEVSDDLQTWTSLGVVLTDLNRPVVIDAGAASKPYRFYRAKGTLR